MKKKFKLLFETSRRDIDSALRITGTTRPLGVAAAKETSTKSLQNLNETVFTEKNRPVDDFVGGIINNTIDGWLVLEATGSGFDEGRHETKFLVVSFFK